MCELQVGKLTDESLDNFLSELSQIGSHDQSEGDAARYFEHADTLLHTLLFLRRNPNFKLQDANVRP
jgi:hypothetical protein